MYLVMDRPVELPDGAVDRLGEHRDPEAFLGREPEDAHLFPGLVRREELRRDARGSGRVEEEGSEVPPEALGEPLVLRLIENAIESIR